MWIGLRGKPAWSVPICGKCEHDLRWTKPERMTDCPECGADLTGPKAVRFVRGHGRRWGLIVWGAVLLSLPIMGTGVLFVARHFVAPSPGNLRALTTQQLLQQQLPKRVDEPWVWNELEDRLRAGSLSQPDVDGAIKVLILHMTTTRPQGWDQPLSWQDDFLKAATQAGMISEPTLFDLCDAFYGPQPIIRPLPRVREQKQGFEIEIEYGNTWSTHSGLPVELLWEVNRVLLDGKPLEVRQNYKHGEQWSGHYDGGLQAGDYEISVEVQCAYVDPDKLIGLNENDLPAKRWPVARKRWKQSVSAPLKVYSADQPIVRLTTDPARHPGKTGGIKIDRFVVQAESDGRKKIILKTEFPAALSIPLSCDVAVAFDGQAVELGRLWVVHDQNSQTSSGSQLEQRVDSLDSSIKHADIILTPNPSHIEHRPEVSEIWGKKIILQGVPIERLDLEPAQGTEEP